MSKEDEEIDFDAKIPSSTDRNLMKNSPKIINNSRLTSNKQLEEIMHSLEIKHKENSLGGIAEKSSGKLLPLRRVKPKPQQLHTHTSNIEITNSSHMTTFREEEKHWYDNPCIKKSRKCVKKFIDSYTVTIFMLLITLFVLFASDVKAYSLGKDVDGAFNIIQTIFFGFFVLEILLASYAVPNYLFSFFFWLDIISTISLIQEIDFIFDPLMDKLSGADSTGNSKGTAKSIAKATSAGRITRVLRIVRIIRLIRIVKLYKSTIQARKQLAMSKKQKMMDKVGSSVSTHNRRTTVLTQADKVDNKAFEEFNKRIDTDSNNQELNNHKGTLTLTNQQSPYLINNYVETPNIVVVDGNTGNVFNNFNSTDMFVDKNKLNTDGDIISSPLNSPQYNKNNIIKEDENEMNKRDKSSIKTFRIDTILGNLDINPDDLLNEDGHFNTMVKFEKNKNSLDIENKKTTVREELYNEMKRDENIKILNTHNYIQPNIRTKIMNKKTHPLDLELQNNKILFTNNESKKDGFNKNAKKVNFLAEENIKEDFNNKNDNENTKLVVPERKAKEESMEDIIKESNISKILNESITKKLIILILGMILGLTVISENMFTPETKKYNDLLPYYLSNMNFFMLNEYDEYEYDYTQGYLVHTKFGDYQFRAKKIEKSDVNYTIAKKLQDVVSQNGTTTTQAIPLGLNETTSWDDRKFNSSYSLAVEDDLIHVSNSEINVTDYILMNQTMTINNQILKLPITLYRILIYKTDDVFPIINITYRDNLIFINETSSDYNYRDNEVEFTYSRDQLFLITTSTLYDTQLGGLLNILKTIFIMILIIIGAIVFENDTKTLVLNPLEIMIEIVEMVQKDPTIAKDAKNLQMGVKNLANRPDAKKEDNNKEKKKIAENSEKYEVIMIQNSIVKISSLLAICFGEAGGEIIRKNLKKGKDLNPMLPGKKKNAIFGFCDIRQFSDVNDALQEKTMIFVNQISEIVHSCVDRFSGSTNKNIGDAYLSAWRFVKKIETNDGELPIKKEVKCDLGNPDAMFIADQSVLAFLQVIIKINSDIDILAYRTDVDILEHPALKNYQVKMGFGLHLGWAIEGAIGSTYKIDASYLSPNVNISARLEAATKQYGVYILISGELFDLCSQDIKCICRLIDVVAVKGSVKPIRLYTVDVNISKLTKDRKKKHISAKKRFEKFAKDKEYLHSEGKRSGGLINYILETHAFRRLLHMNRSVDFIPTFEEATDCYIDGDWERSKELLEECLEMDSNDGPSKTLYEFMKGENFIPPDDWKGFRSLTSK